MSGDAGGGHRYPDDPSEKRDLESADEFISIGRVDWFVTKTWRKLHAVPEFTDEHRADMETEWAVLSPVRLACGRMAAGVQIPGMFTRMGGWRCKGCCRATGMPEGIGSPKNSDGCRAILGLPAGGGPAVVLEADGGDESGERSERGE